jgi:pyruvate formate lyase activating enzyme
MDKEAYVYSKLEGNKVRCLTCQRRCVTAPEEKGWCQTRTNRNGKLYSLIYGEISSLSINPIEKKPVFHFFPGSKWLSAGSVGCNFRCPGCQNWDIAHWKEGPMHTEYISPEVLVSRAKGAHCLGISFTFNEPVLFFEYTLDASRIAKTQGLYTNYVTNGYITKEAFDLITPYLDVYRVDVKGFSEKTYMKTGHIEHFKGILDIAKKAKDRGIHVEIVTNVIPGFNDDDMELRGIASWIKKDLGPETPWHVTRFYPCLELSHLPPTPISALEKAQSIGKEEGLQYVYLGNVPGHEGENTYCPVCGELLIERYVFEIVQNRIRNGRCPTCEATVAGKFG